MIDASVCREFAWPMLVHVTWDILFYGVVLAYWVRLSTDDSIEKYRHMAWEIPQRFLLVHVAVNLFSAVLCTPGPYFPSAFMAYNQVCLGLITCTVVFAAQCSAMMQSDDADATFRIQRVLAALRAMHDEEESQSSTV